MPRRRPGHRGLAVAAGILLGMWPAIGAPSPEETAELRNRYEAMLLKSPDSEAAFDKLVQLASEADALGALDERWKKSAEAGGSGAATFSVLRARLAERQGRIEDAQKLFAGALAADPGNRAIWRLFAAEEQGAGRPEKALDAQQKVLELGAKDEERLAALRSIAQLQQRLLRTDDAVKTLQQMVAEFPADAFVLAEAGDALLEAGRTAEARAVFEKLRDQGDAFQKLKTMLRLAEIDAQTKGQAAAVVSYEQVLADSAETSWIHREARQRIEDLFRAQDDLPGLVAYYGGRLKTQPRDVEAVHRLGNVLAALGRNDEAAALFQRAIELAPERMDFIEDYAAQMLAAQKFDVAVETLRKLVRDDPKNIDRADLLGEALWKQAQSTGSTAGQQAAIEAWTSIAPSDSKELSRITRVAEILAKHDLKNEALPWYERGLALEPGAFDQREKAAGILTKLGRKKDADAMLAGAIAGDRDRSENYATLAGAYRRIDDTAAALKVVEAGLQKSPKDFDLLMLKSRLLVAEESWAPVVDMQPALMAAIPGPQYVADIERQYLDALASAGQLESRMKALLKAFDAGELRSEADLRMLARVLLRINDGEGAQRVLAAAAKAYPAAIELARLQSDYEQRFGTPESQRAVFRRLAELAPAGRAQWLAEIAQSWQGDGKWDEALKAAAERLKLSPANADGYLFYADICFAANRPAEGIAKLLEAVGLSDDPVSVRQRLARAYAESGDSDKALFAQEEAFEQETDPEKKLRLIAPLAEYYLQAGRIDELIERLKQRRQQDEGTHYSAYLAQIYLRLNDYGSAREELARGLAIRPRDAALLRQLLNLSESEQNGVERLRDARTLAEVDPSFENRIILIDALVGQGENEAAVALLREMGPEVAKQGAAGSAVSQLLATPALRDATIALLRDQLTRDGADWKAMLALATILIVDRSYADADALLRKVQSLDDSQLETPAASGATMAPIFRYRGMVDQPEAFQRLIAVDQGVNEMMNQLRSARQMRYQRGRSRSSRGGMAYQPQGNNPIAPPAAAIRAGALAARAFMAVERGEEGKFIADWKQDAAARKLSPEQRIEELSAMQADEELRKEAWALAAEPAATPLQLQMASFVLQNRRSADEVMTQEDQTRFANLLQRIVATSPPKFDGVHLGAISFLQRMGRKVEAARMLDGLLEKLDRNDPNQLTAAMQSCVQFDRLDKARELLGILMAQIPGISAGAPGVYPVTLQAGWQLACRMIQVKEHRAEGMALLAAILRESYGAKPPGMVPMFRMSGLRGTLSRHGGGSASMLMPENLENTVPLATKWFNYYDRDRLRMLYSVLKSAGALDEFLAVLKEQEAVLRGGEQLYPRMAAIQLAWLDGRRKTAVESVRQMAKEHPEEDFGAFLAAMLALMKDYPGASAALATSQTRDKSEVIRNVLLGMTIATMQRDPKQAKALAAQLEKLSPQSDERSVAANMLSALDLDEDARRLQNSAQRSRRNTEPPLIKRMQQLTADKDRKQAVSIARGILLGGMPAPIAGQSDNLRNQALGTLQRFSALEELIAEVSEQLRKQPESVKLNAFMVELARSGDSARAIPYLQKLAALQPQDDRIQQVLAQQLRSSKRNAEAMEIYRGLMRRSFLTVLQENYSAPFEAFREAGKTSEFLELFEQLAKENRMELAEQFGHVYQSYANSFEEAGDLAGAERMCRLGIDAGVTDSNLQQSYLRLLKRQNRKADAVKWIGEMLFPTPKPPRLLLASASPSRQETLWNSWMSNSDGSMRNMGGELLRTVAAPEDLDGLLRRAHAFREERPSDPAARIGDIYVRVRARDATVLKEVRALIEPAPNEARNEDASLAQALAYELVDWPEARPLALDLALAARDQPNQGAIDPARFAQMTKPLIDMALECGRPEIAKRETAKVLENLKSAGPGRVGQVDSDMLFQILDLAQDAGLAREALGLIETLKNTAARRSDIREKLALREPDYRIAAGESVPPQAVVWMVSAESDARVTLAWRLGAARASNGKDGRVEMSRQDLPKLDGNYDLELVAEVPPNVRRRLATIRGAKFVGRWTGRLPAGARSVTGVLRERGNQEAVYGGVELPVGVGANLVRNPDLDPARDGESVAGWTLDGEVRQIPKGGPDKQASATKISTQDRPVKLLGELIPLERNRDYAQSVWCAPLSRAGYEVGVVLFDGNKKRLDSNSCSSWNSGGGWALASQGLSTRENCPPGFRSISRNAKWMQPYIECNGPTWVSGMRLFELPADTEPNSE